MITNTERVELPFDYFSPIAERARLLHANMLDGYQPGFERTLARELIAALTPEQRTKTLHGLLWQKMLEVLEIDVGLDECAESTYALIGTVTSMTLAEISLQDNEAHALESLVTDEICSGQQSIYLELTA